MHDIHIYIYDKYLYKLWNHHSKIALTIDHIFFPTFLGFRNPSRSCVPERPWRRVIRWPGGYHMVPLCPWRWVGVVGIQWDLSMVVERGQWSNEMKKSWFQGHLWAWYRRHCGWMMAGWCLWIFCGQGQKQGHKILVCTDEINIKEATRSSTVFQNWDDMLV